MGILRNVSALGYARVEEWEPEEKKHREAQFLIYKTLQKADRVIGYRRKPSWLVRLRLRLKIGRRLNRTVVRGFSKARARVSSRLFHGAAASPSASVSFKLAGDFN